METLVSLFGLAAFCIQADVNADCSVDVVDTQAVISCVLGSPEPWCDVNLDGDVNVSDAIAVANATLEPCVPCEMSCTDWFWEQTATWWPNTPVPAGYGWSYEVVYDGGNAGCNIFSPSGDVLEASVGDSTPQWVSPPDPATGSQLQLDLIWIDCVHAGCQGKICTSVFW